MNRRSFIKSLGVVFGSAAVSRGASAEVVDDGSFPFEDAIECGDVISDMWLKGDAVIRRPICIENCLIEGTARVESDRVEFRSCTFRYDGDICLSIGDYQGCAVTNCTFLPNRSLATRIRQYFVRRDLAAVRINGRKVL